MKIGEQRESGRNEELWLLLPKAAKARNIPGSDFEAIDESSLQVNPDSAQAGASPQSSSAHNATVTSSATAAAKNNVISLVPQQTTYNVHAEESTTNGDNS